MKTIRLYRQMPPFIWYHSSTYGDKWLLTVYIFLFSLGGTREIWSETEENGREQKACWLLGKSHSLLVLWSWILWCATSLHTRCLIPTVGGLHGARDRNANKRLCISSHHQKSYKVLFWRYKKFPFRENWIFLQEQEAMIQILAEKVLPL